jgi:Methyltransferase domain
MLQRIKRAVGSVPVVGIALRRVYRSVLSKPGLEFHNSHQYWDDRYRKGGNSGPGSYNRLAYFKAEVLNQFVRERGVETVIEFGCGDGAQLRLAEYPSYIGVDVSPWAVNACKKMYRGDPDKSFLLSTEVSSGQKADLALSLDVIFHLVEDEIFEAYMRKMFQVADRYVVIYSSNYEQAWSEPHVHHRAFNQWVDRNQPEWHLRDMIKNKYPYDARDPENTSFSDFFIYQRR